MHRARPAFILTIALCGAGTAAGQGLSVTIGYADLQARLGAATPNGAGVWVAQIEAGASNAYAPDPVIAVGRPGFNITAKSGTTGFFPHATSVADSFYGNVSMASGVTRVDSWQSDNWLMSGFLSSSGGGLPPISNIPKVSNHSYVGSAGSSADTFLRRVDYLVDRGGQIVVAAAGGSTDPLIGGAPNAIAVGSFWGGGSPHIVTPDGSLSGSTPIVSAATALLVQAGGSTQFASNPQTIKAVLLAGATKTGFNGTWSHTQTQPLDQSFGAGMLNVNNSHLILSAGRKAASNSATVSNTGWDFNSVSSTGTSFRNYFFDVPAGSGNTLSAALTWHRVVDSSLNASLANLNLKLYQADSNFNLVGSPLDQSISSSDNVEHIWMANGLPGGRYAWRVEAASGSGDYALAWQTIQFVPVPEPVSILAVASVVLAAGMRLRRRASARREN